MTLRLICGWECNLERPHAITENSFNDVCMCNCANLLVRLFKIFRMKGTPTATTLPNLEKMGHFSPLFPSWQAAVENRKDYVRAAQNTVLDGQRVDLKFCFTWFVVRIQSSRESWSRAKQKTTVSCSECLELCWSHLPPL